MSFMASFTESQQQFKICAYSYENTDMSISSICNSTNCSPRESLAKVIFMFAFWPGCPITQLEGWRRATNGTKMVKHHQDDEEHGIAPSIATVPQMIPVSTRFHHAILDASLLGVRDWISNDTQSLFHTCPVNSCHTPLNLALEYYFASKGNELDNKEINKHATIVKELVAADAKRHDLAMGTPSSLLQAGSEGRIPLHHACCIPELYWGAQWYKDIFRLLIDADETED